MNKLHSLLLALLFLLPSIGLKALMPVDTLDYDLLEISDKKKSCCPEGVTVLDLIGISRHLQKLESFEDPLQLIAADVNEDSELTAVDLERLREFILNEQPPFSQPVPVDSLSKTPKSQNIANIKIGDVLSEADFRSDPPITLDPVFFLPDLRLCHPGKEVRFDLKVENFEGLRAFQFSLKWDAEVMEFHSIENVRLIGFEDSNVGKKAADKGLLTFAWFSENELGSSLDDGTAICSIHFIARAGVQGSTLLSVAEKPTPVQVLHYNLSEANPLFENGSLTIESATPLSIESKPLKELVCSGKQSGAIDLHVSGGSLPYVFEWNNGASTEDLSSLMEGNYAVTVTDAGGCSQQAAFTISNPNKIIADVAITNASGENKTDGAVVINGISGGTPPYSFLWNNAATTPSIFQLRPGTYFVTLTDKRECEHFFSYEINPLQVATNIENTDVKMRLQSNPISAGNQIVLEFVSLNAVEAQLFLFKKEDKLVWGETLFIQNGKSSHHFEPPGEKGNYLLQIQLKGGGVKTLKLQIL